MRSSFCSFILCIDLKVVGIYGYGFFHAGYHVCGIFASKGLLLIEEGTLVEMVLQLSSGLVALCTGAIGCCIAYAHVSNNTKQS